MSRRTERDPNLPGEDAGTAPDEGILRRWSRRKHEARRDQEQTGQPKAADSPPAEPSASAPAPERVLTDADMPPLESLDEDSDFSLFMSPGVSEALRQAALRRLFRSPRLNQLCELEGEYFDASGFQPLGNIVTHEMRAELEREAEKLKDRAERALGDELTADQDPTSTPDPTPEGDAPSAASVDDAPGEVASAPPGEPGPAGEGNDAETGGRSAT